MFGQEAVIVYTPQSSEELLVRVADIVYGGGNEYVYRLSVDTRPQIDFVLPLTVTAAPTTVTAYGRNLPVVSQPASRLVVRPDVTQHAG